MANVTFVFILQISNLSDTRTWTACGAIIFMLSFQTRTMMTVTNGVLTTPIVEVTLLSTLLDIQIDAISRISHARIISSKTISELHTYHKVIRITQNKVLNQYQQNRKNT